MVAKGGGGYGSAADVHGAGHSAAGGWGENKLAPAQLCDVLQALRGIALESMHHICWLEALWSLQDLVTHGCEMTGP